MCVFNPAWQWKPLKWPRSVKMLLKYEYMCHKTCHVIDILLCYQSWTINYVFTKTKISICYLIDTSNLITEEFFSTAENRLPRFDTKLSSSASARSCARWYIFDNEKLKMSRRWWERIFLMIIKLRSTDFCWSVRRNAGFKFRLFTTKKMKQTLNHASWW